MHDLAGTPGHAQWSTMQMRGLAFGLFLLLGSCFAGCTGAPSSYQPPTGWQAIPLPTTQLEAEYAISPDVAGLIVACIGDKLGGPAALWSTRDNGAHWQQFPFAGLIGGCELAVPPGGDGTIFLLNVLATTPQQQALLVSHDAGQTWHTVATSADFQSAQDPYGNDSLQALFTLIATGVYRQGRLYAGSQLDQTSSSPFALPAFSVSTDDGRTWTTLETGSDPLAAQHYLPLGLAPDYRAPGAWFRLLGPDMQASAPAPAMLEHSRDDGHTWTLLGPTGPVGRFGWTGMATLATTPTQPTRLCAGIAAEVSEPPRAASVSYTPPLAPTLRFGPPPTPPQTLALAASSDGGGTWQSTTLIQSSHTDRLASSVLVDAAGTCFLAENYSVFEDSDPDVASIWKLDTGATARPQRIWQLHHQIISTLVLTSEDPTQHANFLAIMDTYHKHTTSDGYAITSDTPRLIWTEAS